MKFRTYKNPTTKLESTPVAETETARKRILEAAGFVVLKEWDDTQSLPAQTAEESHIIYSPEQSESPAEPEEAPEAILAALYGARIAKILTGEGLTSKAAVDAHADDELAAMGLTLGMIKKVRKTK